MTKIDFFSNAPNRLDYVARLLRKVHAAQQNAVVIGDAAVLNKLSDALWHIYGFLAHDVQPIEGDACPASIALVSESMVHFPHHDVMINLTDETPENFARFTRLIEVVPNEPEPKQAARDRWAFYKARGYAMTHHDIAAKVAQTSQ